MHCPLPYQKFACSKLKIKKIKRRRKKSQM
jgi:hypothetical protein